MFQTCMMYKDTHHPPSTETLIGALQVLLVWTWIWGKCEITCHASIWIPKILRKTHKWQWACLPLSICENVQSYQLLLMTNHSQIQIVISIPLLKIVCGIFYPLNFCRKQRVYFWCGLWGIIYCLPTEITWICILPPGYAFCFKNSVVGALWQLRFTLGSL